MNTDQAESDDAFAATNTSAHPTSRASTPRPILSVLIPCLNESATVADCVRDAWTGIGHLNIPAEVVVVDNGSKDGSADLATLAGARVVYEPTRGYGAAIRAGINACRGDYVIYADADRSYDLTQLGAIWASLNAGHDLVIGNRFAGVIAPGAMPWSHRRLGNPWLSALGRRLLHTDVGDFHCGIRGLRKTSILSLHLRTNGMEFASEIIASAVRQRLSISQVPVDLAVDGRPAHAHSHLRPYRDALRHVRVIIKLRTRDS